MKTRVSLKYFVNDCGLKMLQGQKQNAQIDGNRTQPLNGF